MANSSAVSRIRFARYFTNMGFAFCRWKPVWISHLRLHSYDSVSNCHFYRRAFDITGFHVFSFSGLYCAGFWERIFYRAISLVIWNFFRYSTPNCLKICRIFQYQSFLSPEFSVHGCPHRSGLRCTVSAKLFAFFVNLVRVALIGLSVFDATLSDIYVYC